MRTMTSDEARQRFNDLLGFIMRDKETVVVEEQGKPVAVVISPDQFELLEAEKEQRRRKMWEAIERLGQRNADKDPDEVMADVTAAVEEVRRERYEREQREAEGRR